MTGWPIVQVDTRELMERVAAAYEESRPMLWLGVLGLALAAACAVKALSTGLTLPPEGDLSKAISFDAAVGIYILTIGVYAPLAGFSSRGRRRWLGWAVGLGLYAYATETIQTLRGLDPRFSHHFTPLDQIAGILFGLAAIALIVHFGVLAMKLVSRPTAGTPGLMLLALRYACLSVAFAFAAGLWMIIIQGRRTGVAGNILPLHAAGFHGLQAIPIVAFLLARSRLADQTARRWIHAAGLAWAGLCAGIAWQTIAGRPVLQLTPAILFAIAGTAIWAACALFSTYLWQQRADPAAAR
ncbi:MAG TPA: hypothetical protein VEV17_24550 [Bryobacteraceae bacterium]|nr:hypothetical protein [Bryobacteraceae bacterium]